MQRERVSSAEGRGFAVQRERISSAEERGLE